MYKVEETRKLFGKAYHVEVANFKRLVYVISRIKEMDNFTYMFLINSYGETIKEVYQYLNVHFERSTYKKRELALNALKCLYSFVEVFNIHNLDSMDITYRNKIIGFLQGGEFSGVDTMYNLETERTNSTINNYFSVYRAFFKYLNIDNTIFSESSTIYIQKGGTSEDGFMAHSKRVRIEKFDISLKTKQKKEVPKYIRFEEYKKIIELIEDKYSLREKIICRLMYEYGLRIGEVLGLTLEDIIFNEELYDSGDCALILRNRYTDKHYQFAKSCMKITSAKDYSKPQYNDEEIGYQTIRISSEVTMLIQDYIEETRSPFSLTDKGLNNLSTKNIADKVSHREDIEINQYIFIGKNYTPITSKGWNDNLKKIFTELGIEVDKGKKSDNLNHRFRHGFAMFKVLVENYDLLRLRDALRHTNSHTSTIYFNPTEEDRKAFAHLSQQLLEKAGIKL